MGGRASRQKGRLTRPGYPKGKGPCGCGCGQPAAGEYKRGHRPAEPLDSRFWSKVDIRGDDGCWEWQAHIEPSGYGQIGTRGQATEYAHRVAVMLDGRDPRDALVCHTCDNRSCCNPAHLYIGTPLTNARDVCERGDWNHPTGEDHPHVKLTDDEVREIRDRFVREYRIAGGACPIWRSNARELGAEFGVHKTYVLDLVRGKWRAAA